MKILIDTNVALDVLLNRVQFVQAAHAVFKQSAQEKVLGVITTNTFTDMYYILYKQSKDAATSQMAITQLLKLVTLEAIIPADVSQALASNIADLEDAILCFAAQRLHADYIVTRNVADFTHSPVPAITPVEYMNNN